MAISEPRWDWILHTLLRPHEDAVAVQMAGEGDALLRDLPQTRQREHLKAAGGPSGWGRPHRMNRAVHPSAHHVIAGAQVQVVGIGQLDLASQLLQVESIDAALDGPLCSTFMNTGVCTSPPWAHRKRPRRAVPSVLMTSNMEFLLYHRGYTPPIYQIVPSSQERDKKVEAAETYSIIYVTEFSRKLRKKQVIFYENQ